MTGDAAGTDAVNSDAASADRESYGPFLFFKYARQGFQ